MTKNVLVPIANGSEEIEAVSIIDTLRRSSAHVDVASVEKTMEITASRGVKLTADKYITECLDTIYDAVVIPGGMPGAETLRDSKELVEILKKQVASNRLYAAICASPVVVLKHHGFLGTRKATCHPAFFEQLDQAQIVKSSSVVVDQNCITSGGPGTAIIFSLKLVELLYSSKIAGQIAAAMVV